MEELLLIKWNTTKCLLFTPNISLSLFNVQTNIANQQKLSILCLENAFSIKNDLFPLRENASKTKRKEKEKWKFSWTVSGWSICRQNQMQISTSL